MDYRELFRKENQKVMERYELSMERIRQMPQEAAAMKPYGDYFCQVAGFIGMVEELCLSLGRDEMEGLSLSQLKDWNQRLYAHILPANYESSYANPAYGAKQLGLEMGQLLSYLYREIRGDIVFAYESRLTEITILNEVFIEIYNMFEEGASTAARVKDALYWFVSDYCDVTEAYRLRESFDPSLAFAKDIIMHRDLNDLRYLYRFGDYISEKELATAAYLNSLPKETICRMADVYTEGFRKGFQVVGRDLSKKKTVSIRYRLGFERMVRQAVKNFQEMGLETIFTRAPVWSITSSPDRKSGYFGASANKQYEYDHRYDQALFLDKALKERKLAVLRVAYEQYKRQASQYAGPAVLDTFGEAGFEPVNKPEALAFNEKQEKIALEMANEGARLANQYVPMDETSFTIIAFPVPDIGKDFQEIFKETINVNTLGCQAYQRIQDKLIQALDQAAYVSVLGKGDNATNLRVALHPLADPEKETNFENCLADVNIPLGEVFTSPKLFGTEGTLFVGNVYVGDFQFKNLRLEVKDGYVVDYACDNFKDPQEGRQLVKQVILKNHQSLPMGEFAIGTNTTAYAMAMKYKILDKLPILMVEKMGPHFAFGDTCYSWSEDSPMYNLDGKEVVARDNEVSILRKEDPSKAYFNCHTDITIPYQELGLIEAIRPDGTKVAIIRDGRFVLEGTQDLNLPLEEW